MRVLALLVVACMLLAACQATPSASPSGAATPAGLSDAVVETVLRAFDDHPVVAIGESHRSVAEHEFLRTLISDPRLAGVIDDVAVEFGSARHQDVIDRYASGANVDDAELQLVWTDTTQRSGVWDHPVYRQFFDRIRALNAERGPDQQMRVLLGDPPIDWDAITAETDCSDRDPTCLDHWILSRDTHFAEVVRREGLAHHHNVLVVAGSGHVLRNPTAEAPISLTDQLDAMGEEPTWALVPADEALISLVGDALEPAAERPAIVPLAGSGLGELVSAEFFAGGTVTCEPGPCETPPAVSLGSLADALLLL